MFGFYKRATDDAPAKDAARTKAAATTGESHPLARRIGKGVAFAVWCMFTVAAMGMSYVVGVERWEAFVEAGVLANELARNVAFAAMVLVYLGADAWVGVSGIIIKATRRWTQPAEADRGGFWKRTLSFWNAGPWIWLGRIVFILALALSSTNKVAFLGSMGQAQVTAAIDAQSGADRRLVNQYPDVRGSAIVEAELAGVAAELTAKQAQIAVLERREGRYTWATKVAYDEAAGIVKRKTPLDTELTLAKNVEAARARLVAVAAKDAGTTRAEEDAIAEKVADPRDAWLARVFNIKVWWIALAVIGIVALLHELGCAALLGLATMRPPAWAIEEETAFLVISKTASAERRAKIDIAKVEQRMALSRARAEAAAKARMIPTIAAAAAHLEEQRTLRDIRKMREEALGPDGEEEINFAPAAAHAERRRGWERFARDTVFGVMPRWFKGERKNGDDFIPNVDPDKHGLPRPKGFDNIERPVIIEGKFEDVVAANVKKMRAAAADAAKQNGKPVEPPILAADIETETDEQRALRLANAEAMGVTDQPRGSAPREQAEKVA